MLLAHTDPSRLGVQHKIPWSARSPALAALLDVPKVQQRHTAAALLLAHTGRCLHCQVYRETLEWDEPLPSQRCLVSLGQNSFTAPLPPAGTLPQPAPPLHEEEALAEPTWMDIARMPGSPETLSSMQGVFHEVTRHSACHAQGLGVPACITQSSRVASGGKATCLAHLASNMCKSPGSLNSIQDAWREVTRRSAWRCHKQGLQVCGCCARDRVA